MKTICTLPLIIFLSITPPAFGEEIPKSGVFDNRIRTVNYNPDEVFLINVGFRSAAEIVFEQGESISNIAVGDSVSWEVAPSDNIIFLKPREKAPSTNMIVTTKSGSSVRMYHFILRATPGIKSESSGVMFGLRFLYPQAKAARAAAIEQKRLRQEALQIEASTIELALDAAVAIGPRNLNYVIAGSSAIAPSEISDNGTSTVLRFPRNQAVPAIFKVLPDGSESVVNYTVMGDFVIVNELVNQLRLRMGESLSCIWNLSYDPYGDDTSSGTVSPEVNRSVEGG